MRIRQCPVNSPFAISCGCTASGQHGSRGALLAGLHFLVHLDEILWEEEVGEEALSVLNDGSWTETATLQPSGSGREQSVYFKSVNEHHLLCDGNASHHLHHDPRKIERKNISSSGKTCIQNIL